MAELTQTDLNKVRNSIELIGNEIDSRVVGSKDMETVE